MVNLEPAVDDAPAGRARAAVLLAVLCAAQFVLIVDVVVVNVAIPAIRADLDIAAGTLQLTSVAYTVTFGSLLILAGRLGDLFGRRRLLVIGLAVFTAASVLCALAGEGWQLFAARAAQGVGAALVSPNALALLVGIFRQGKERNRALGIWAAVASTGAIAGQLLGGAITEVVGWRGIFLVNVPIGVVAIVLAIRIVPALAQERRPAHLDAAGALLLAAALGGASLLLAATVTGAEAATATIMVTGVVLVAVLAATLVLVERRHPDPIVPSALLRRPNVLVANVVLMLHAAALGAALYFSTLTMQTEMGYGPLQTGLGFAPITVVVLLISPRAGTLIERFGANRLLMAGAAFGALGALLLGTTSSVADTYWTGILPGLTLMAVGSGLSYAPTFSLATDVPEDQHGRASGLINTAQELGAAAGLAAIGSLAAGAAAGGQLVDFTAGYLSAAAAMTVAGALVFALRSRLR